MFQKYYNSFDKKHLEDYIYFCLQQINKHIPHLKTIIFENQCCYDKEKCNDKKNKNLRYNRKKIPYLKNQTNIYYCKPSSIKEFFLSHMKIRQSSYELFFKLERGKFNKMKMYKNK